MATILHFVDLVIMSACVLLALYATMQGLNEHKKNKGNGRGGGAVLWDPEFVEDGLMAKQKKGTKLHPSPEQNKNKLVLWGHATCRGSERIT